MPQVVEAEALRQTGHLDTTTRAALSSAGSFNTPGTLNAPTAEGAAGQLLGIPVYVDTSVTTTDCTGNNRDRVYLLYRPDLVHYSTPPNVEAFTAPWADQLSVLLRVYSYHALLVDRQPQACRSSRKPDW